MSCDHQVKDADPDKPCPICEESRQADLMTAAAQERFGKQRIRTLGMMRRGWKPEEKKT